MTISPPPHFVIFPFMAQGHTIPLLYLSRILSNRGINVTIITTPANFSSIKTTLENDSINIIDIPFPVNNKNTTHDDVPPGIELTDNLPSMSLFVTFIEATEQLKHPFEEVVTSLKPVSCIISDGFLIWTQDSAEKLGIPRLVFYGTNIFSMTMCNIMQQVKPHANVGSNDEPFLIPGFENNNNKMMMKLTVNDFEPPFSELDPKGPLLDFVEKQQKAMARSHGMVVNSFYELEAKFIDYWNRNSKPSASSDIPIKAMEKPTWIEWLDKKLETKDSVVYVSFGTQAEASSEQIHEVAIGLEKSNISFIWVVKPKQLQYMGQGFEDRVKEKGKVVTEWVDQMEILKHENVSGFLSHCGWNSMLESMCAGVPVLVMPLMAEQHLNARLVVEEIGMGLRLWPMGRVARGLVEAEEVAKMVVELMEGEDGRKVRERVIEVRKVAYGAMKKGGSSSTTLDSLINHVCELVHSMS